MATAITIAIPAGDAAAVAWPSRCVGCGGAATTASNLAIAKVVTAKSGTQRPVKLTMAVPHCSACAQATKAVFVAQLVPFAVGFLGMGGVAFAAVAFGAMRAGLDDVGRPANANSLVLAAAAGLGAGLAGGFVIELLARLPLLPVFGRALWRAPLFVPSLFTDADHVAGVTARPNQDLTALTFAFAHDDIASEFASLNP